MEISATLTEKIVFLSVEANIMMDIAILQKSALAVAMKAGNDESFFAKSKRAICQARSTQHCKVFFFIFATWKFTNGPKCKERGPKAVKSVFGYNCDKKALMKPI